MKTEAAIFGFDGSRRLGRATMYKGMNDDQKEGEGGGGGVIEINDLSPFPPPTVHHNSKINE